MLAKRRDGTAQPGIQRQAIATHTRAGASKAKPDMGGKVVWCEITEGSQRPQFQGKQDSTSGGKAVIVRLKSAWADSTELERWLVGILAVVLAVLFFVFSAWQQQLIPWERRYGSVAEWVGAVATAGGLGWAVFTLRVNARDQTARAEAEKRAEAARVALDWNEDILCLTNISGDGETQSYLYRAEVHNAGSSPIRDFVVWLDGIDGVVYKTNGEQWAAGEMPMEFIDTVVPGARKKFEFNISWRYSITNDTDTGYRVTRAASFGFNDVLNNRWVNAKGKLKKVQSAKEDTAILK